MDERLDIAELEHIHSRMNEEDREELLQCLLIAACHGGEHVIEVLEELCLTYAAEELLAAAADENGPTDHLDR